VGNLETKTKHDASKLFGLNLLTPHPLTDPITGETYNIGSAVQVTGTKYSVLRVPRAQSSVREVMKGAEVIASIPSFWTGFLSYNHSFGLTPNYLILIEQPLFISVSKVLGSKMASKEWLQWRPEARNHFHIIEKRSGRVLFKGLHLVSSAPFFFLHIINCFESPDEGTLTIDLNIFDTPEVMDAQLLSVMRGSGVGGCGCELPDDPQNQASSVRFILPLSLTLDCAEDTNLLKGGPGASAIRHGKTLTLSPQPILGTKGLEFPTINHAFQGLKYEYYFASGLTTRGHFRNAVAKVDVGSGEAVSSWRMSEHGILGEPVFAGGGGAKDEDEGILLVPMTDARAGEPDMLFFVGAKDMKEVGRAVFQNRVPPAQHGLYVPQNNRIPNN
jgi:carotenoid cleavage dioxygenase-like enzyme